MASVRCWAVGTNEGVRVQGQTELRGNGTGVPMLYMLRKHAAETAKLYPGLRPVRVTITWGPRRG